MRTKSLCIIITKPAFGKIHAAEAIRLANGALSYGHKVSLILIEDGILVAKRGQKAEEGSWTALAPLVERISKSPNAVVLGDIENAGKLGIKRDELVQGIKLVEPEAITSQILSSERAAIF